MGGSSWSSDAYRNLKTDYSTKTKDKIFTSTKLASDMDPKGVKFREARDSDAHPNTVGIMVWLDVTGSMGDIPNHLIKEKLGTMIETMMAHGIADPAVFFGGIGDHLSDRSPLQIGQFESGTAELNKWLTSIYLEGGGGGQDKESYLLAWLFGARHTSLDCFEKRGQKGFLFTIGDEGTWEDIDADTLKNLMGYTEASTVTAKDLLSEAERQYHVFHIRIMETSHGSNKRVGDQWKGLLGERVINCDDHNVVGEIMASTVALVHGAELKDITESFDQVTAFKVSNALANVPKGGALSTKQKSVIEL